MPGLEALDADVVVVGLGTAGAAAAALCARRGLRVVGVEARPLGEAGARWVNGVPGWMFDAAGIDRPSGVERVGEGHPYWLVAGWDGARVRIRGGLDVDMRHLVARLQALAAGAGAALHGEARVQGFDGRVLRTSLGDLRARWFVDASGLTGARLLGQPDVAREDLCASAQEVRAIDRGAAARWFAERGAAPGDVLCFTGVAGGYSIVNVRIAGDRLSTLTGSIPALGHPSGRALLDRFVAEHPWVGPRAFGGARAIPLARPLIRVGQGAVAAIGDAARQVHAAHGSGIGQQLLAAALLAESLAESSGPDGYNVRWQRAHGGALAGADLFRRFAQRLDVADLDRLLAHGVLSPALIAEAHEQRSARPPARAVLRAARGLRHAPRVAVRLLPLIPRLRLVEAHYRRYPSDPNDLPAWRRRLERIAG